MNKNEHCYNEIREITHSCFIMHDGTHVDYAGGEEKWMRQMAFHFYLDKKEMNAQGLFDPKKHKFFMMQCENMHSFIISPWNVILAGTESITGVKGHSCIVQAIDEPSGYQVLHIKKHQLDALKELARDIGLLINGKAIIGPIFWYTDNNVFKPKGFPFQPIKFTDKGFITQELKYIVATAVLGLKRRMPAACRLLMHTPAECRLSELVRILDVIYNYTPKKRSGLWICTRPYPEDCLVTEAMLDFLEDCILSKDIRKQTACKKVLLDLNRCIDLCVEQLPYRKMLLSDTSRPKKGLVLQGRALSTFDFMPKMTATTLGAILNCMEKEYDEKGIQWVKARQSMDKTKIITQCLSEGTRTTVVNPQNPCVFVKHFSGIQCLLAFVKNDFPVERSIVLAQYEGMYFKELPDIIQQTILDIQITLNYYSYDQPQITPQG